MKIEQIILQINTDKKFRNEFIKSFLEKNSGRAKIAKKFNLSQEKVRLAQNYLRGKEGFELTERMQKVYPEFLKIHEGLTITEICTKLGKDYSTIRACYWYFVGQSMNFKKLYE